MCANASYQQSEEDLRELMGIEVGHSTLHRLVQRVDLPLAEASTPSEVMSVDGGKICLRGESKSQEWLDYKLVSLHGGVCEAFFQAGDFNKVEQYCAPESHPDLLRRWASRSVECD